MSKAPKTTVVIACYNGEPWLHKLLYILSHEGCQVIAIDNNSTDDTSQILRLYYPFAQAVRNESNEGFARANNRGAALADEPYILFLNQDTEPRQGFIKAMEKRMKRRKKTAIVGAKLIFPVSNVDHLIYRDEVVHLKRIKGRLDHAGIDLNRDLLPFEVGRNELPSLAQFNEARPYPAVTGACLMVKREVFQELGGFYPGFLNGWEDSDLCLRAWEAGYQVWYEPEAVVDHYHSTSDIRFAKEDENVDLWVQRWHADGRLEALAEKHKKEWRREK